MFLTSPFIDQALSLIDDIESHDRTKFFIRKSFALHSS
jgi:hypothetical protein